MWLEMKIKQQPTFLSFLFISFLKMRTISFELKPKESERQENSTIFLLFYLVLKFKIFDYIWYFC